MANSRYRDVFPQFLRGMVTESAANTFTEAEENTPVPVHMPNNKYLVMNILRVYVQPSDGAADDGDAVDMAIYDRSRAAMPAVSDAGIVAVNHLGTFMTTSGRVAVESPRVFELSDGQGHGILYARSKIYVGIQGASQANPLTGRYAIEYTLVEVDPEEYVGLIEGA